VVLLSAGGVALLLRDDRAAGPAPGELWWRTGEPALDALAPLVAETLGRNRRGFPGVTGPVLGFGAGAHYPQMWIRDSATLLPIARYGEPRERLTSWLVEHLAHQSPDGRLWDWIAAGEPSAFAADAPAVREVSRRAGTALSADRNTSELDQESSAVLAAAEVHDITGDDGWLRQDVAGLPLVDRLERALLFLGTYRDPRVGGLLVGPLTADWGDVTPIHGDQRAIYDDLQAPRVAGLYANAMYAGAARSLAALFRALHDRRAASWDAVARDVGLAIDERLWDEEQGFYRIHARPDGQPLAADDGARFALGGNAVAALHGVAGPERTCRILAAAEAGRRAHGLSTVAATLVPPFPAGFFRHPILREEWTYQNGGQWDWFSGRLLTAAFRAGCADDARLQLDRIARRSAAAGGLYEWYDREDRGKGSARYAGTAAALGQAVVEGLLGASFRAGRLALEVRAGERAVAARLEDRPTGAWLRYDWAFDARRAEARLAWTSNRPGTVAVLAPAGRRPAAARIDGRPAPLKARRIGRDVYAGLDAEPGRHVLEVRFE
jgi:hypothetical protein